jgi:uncharacterized Zn-finger protein
MKVKPVKQYICDFCGKKGLSSGHMKKHERHCTKNPERKCRMCEALGEMQQPIADLMAILPDPAEYAYDDEWGCTGYRDGLFTATDAVMPKLRDLASDCPMCIMAALRQKGIPVNAVKSFDFKKEVQEAFDMINDSNYIAAAYEL